MEEKDELRAELEKAIELLAHPGRAFEIYPDLISGDDYSVWEQDDTLLWCHHDTLLAEDMFAHIYGFRFLRKHFLNIDGDVCAVTYEVCLV